MSDFEKAKEEVRARTDIVAVVGRHVPLKRRGTYWVGRCPFHDDHSPSMHVNPNLGIYKCFVCGAGGDVFKFLIEHEHISFSEALANLARETGVTLPQREASDPEASRRTGAMRAALDWATDWYHQNLLRFPAALDYARRRGLSDAEIADFQLGFAPDNDLLLQEAPRAGHSLDTLQQAGLITRNESGRWRDRFRVRLIFPLSDLSRRTIGFAGRNLRSGRPDIPKYLNSPETELYRKSHFLFGLSHARTEISRSGEAILVEGYMDWFALWREGIRNGVAVSGTAFTRDQARLLARQARRVVCFFDADRAGQAAATRSLPLLLAAGLEVRVATLGGSAAKDPDEYLKAHGADALRERITKGRHWVDFLLSAFLAEHPRPTPDQRAQLLRNIQDLLLAIPDENIRNQCKQASLPYLELLGANPLELARPTPLPNRQSETENTPRPTHSPALPRLRGVEHAEAQLLFLLLEYPVLTLDIQDRLHPSRLTHEGCRELYDLILADSESRGGPPDPKAIASILEEPLAGFVASLFQLFPVRFDEVAARAWIDDFLRHAEVRDLRARRRRLTLTAQVGGAAEEDPLVGFHTLLAEERHILHEDPRP